MTIEAELRAAAIAILSDMLAGLTEGSQSVNAPRSAPEPRGVTYSGTPVVESFQTSTPDEPEWGGLETVDRGKASVDADLRQEFAPIGSHPVCPVHHSSHLVPAGVSKSTGKGYKAFWGCDDRDCTAGRNGKSWRADAA